MAQSFLVRASAWLLEAIGGVAGLRAASRTFLGWVLEAGGHTATYLAGRPRECKLAVRYTLLICSGETQSMKPFPRSDLLDWPSVG